MHEYAITFAAEVDLAATAIERRAEDPAVRRSALLWRARAIPEMRKACFRLEPIGALVDAWIFARQMDHLFSDGAGAAVFGTSQSEAIDVSRRLVQHIREIGGSIAVSPEAGAEFERTFVDPWLADHALRDVTFVRESPIARFAEQSRASGRLSQSVGTMEEMVFTLSQQARIYLADLPRQVRGEVDLMRSDIVSSPEMASVQADLHVSAAAAARIASTAEGILPLILNERQIVLEEMNRQRTLVMEAFSLERERAIGAIVGAVAAERNELLGNFEWQLVATHKWGTAERREALADVRRDLAAAMGGLRSERVLLLDDLRQIIDGVLFRVALFLLAALALAPVVAHGYARVWPRRWQEPHIEPPPPRERPVQRGHGP
jgi:hypothetical protein